VALRLTAAFAPAAVVTALVWVSAGAGVRLLAAQDSAPAPGLQSEIVQLSSLDYATRMNAARLIRRAPAPEAVAALTAAVKTSPDEFVRYRALIVLTGFLDRGTTDLMRAIMSDRNDRVREVAYRWMADHPAPTDVPALLTALQSAQAEFVRPALIRALAAEGSDNLVRRALIAEVGRGLDFFRIGVIDALGEFKGVYARDAIEDVARIEGPLQDDAVLALGRLGDRQSIGFLMSITDPEPEVRPALLAAFCLLGSDCEARVRTIADILLLPGSTPQTIRSATTALAVLGSSGSDEAMDMLASLAGAPRTRNVATIGLGGAALRDPDRMLSWLARQSPEQQTALVAVLAEAFQSLEEDYSEEQFFAKARATYWRETEGSPVRTLMAALIDKLEF